MLKAALKLFALIALFWLPLFWIPGAHAAITITAARVWPAQDYTRLTLESKQSIRHNMFTVSNPERLVVDLEEVEPGNALDELTRLVGSNDPYIKSVRVGRFKPGVVRLVLDLKAEVKPQIFVLKPVAEYGYRLVLDVYPTHPVDPLMALIEPSKSKITEDVSALTATEQPPEKSHAEEQLKLPQSANIDHALASTTAVR